MTGAEQEQDKTNSSVVVVANMMEEEGSFFVALNAGMSTISSLCRELSATEIMVMVLLPEAL